MQSRTTFLVNPPRRCPGCVPNPLPKQPEGEIEKKGQDNAQYKHRPERNVNANLISLVHQVSRQITQIENSAQKKDEPPDSHEGKTRIDEAPAERPCTHDD